MREEYKKYIKCIGSDCKDILNNIGFGAKPNQTQ